MRILLLLLGRQLQALNYLRNSLSFGNALNDLFALHIMQKFLHKEIFLTVSFGRQFPISPERLILEW